MPTRTDVQTDVHIVPVDSDTSIRNLLKVQTVRCALVLYEGNYIPSPAPISYKRTCISLICIHICCLQVVSDILRNILLFLVFLFFSQMMSSKVFAETAHYSWFCSPLNDYYLEAKPDNNVSSEWVGSRIDKELKFNLIMEISIIEVDKKNLNKLPVNFRVYQKGLQFRSIENGFKSLGVTQNIDAKPIKDKNWTHLFYKFGYQPFADDWSFNSLSGDLSPSSLFLKRTSEGLIGSLITNFDFNSLPVLSQNEILTQVFHFKCNNKAAFRVL